jgi:hypothetical protein
MIPDEHGCGIRRPPSCWSCVWDADLFRRSAAASCGEGVASGGCAVSSALSSMAAAGTSPSACSDFCFAALPASGSGCSHTSAIQASCQMSPSNAGYSSV